MILIGFVLLFSALIYSVHSNMMIKRLESKNKSALKSFLKNTDEDEDADNSEIVADNSESDAIHKARREYGDAYDESDRVDNRPKARRQQHSNAVAFLSIKKTESRYASFSRHYGSRSARGCRNRSRN